MLRKRWFFPYALAGLFAALSLPAQAEPKTLTIAADEWCPINCAPGSEKPGIGIELAKQVFEPLGYRVNYVVMPWARALEEVRTGNVDAVVGANNADEPTLLFPMAAIYNITDDFYVRRDSQVRFQSMESLKGLRIGIIKDYGYNAVVNRFLGKARKTPGLVQETSGEDALEQNIRKLLAGRIHLIIESRPVMDYTLARLKLKQEIKWIGGIPQGNVYLAFSPALAESETRVRHYDERIARLRAAGVLKPLYASYQLQAP